MNISYTSRDKRVQSKQKRRHRQKERYIDYHAEAYYRALKRIEEEKQNVTTEEVCVEKEERTTTQTIMLFLKLVFRPGSLDTEFKTLDPLSFDIPSRSYEFYSVPRTRFNHKTQFIPLERLIFPETFFTQLASDLKMKVGDNINRDSPVENHLKIPNEMRVMN